MSVVLSYEELMSQKLQLKERYELLKNIWRSRIGDLVDMLENYVVSKSGRNRSINDYQRVYIVNVHARENKPAHYASYTVANYTEVKEQGIRNMGVTLSPNFIFCDIRPVSEEAHHGLVAYWTGEQALLSEVIWWRVFGAHNRLFVLPNKDTVFTSSYLVQDFTDVVKRIEDVATIDDQYKYQRLITTNGDYLVYYNRFDDHSPISEYQTMYEHYHHQNIGITPIFDWEQTNERIQQYLSDLQQLHIITSFSSYLKYPFILMTKVVDDVAYNKVIRQKLRPIYVSASWNGDINFQPFKWKYYCHGVITFARYINIPGTNMSVVANATVIRGRVKLKAKQINFRIEFPAFTEVVNTEWKEKLLSPHFINELVHFLAWKYIPRKFMHYIARYAWDRHIFLGHITDEEKGKFVSLVCPLWVTSWGQLRIGNFDARYGSTVELDLRGILDGKAEWAITLRYLHQGAWNRKVYISGAIPNPMRLLYPEKWQELLNE